MLSGVSADGQGSQHLLHRTPPKKERKTMLDREHWVEPLKMVTYKVSLALLEVQMEIEGPLPLRLLPIHMKSDCGVQEDYFPLKGTIWP